MQLELTTPERVCSRCREVSIFNAGNQHYCRDCQREYMREYRAKNPEKYQAFLAKQRERKEERNARQRERWLANPEPHRKASRDWKRRNRDKVRATDIRRRYGLEVDEYEAIIARGCAICGVREGKICIDHDHTTGKVRDALCGSCNSALGLLGDDLERARAAVAYLEEHL